MITSSYHVKINMQIVELYPYHCQAIANTETNVLNFGWLGNDAHRYVQVSDISF